MVNGLSKRGWTLLNIGASKAKINALNMWNAPEEHNFSQPLPLSTYVVICYPSS
jgi:hypothetical protein